MFTVSKLRPQDVNWPYVYIYRGRQSTINFADIEIAAALPPLGAIEQMSKRALKPRHHFQLLHVSAVG